ncbi:MAG TPA: hypothetical protein VKG43_04115 [Acidimicrobiales bacterium]|nr:hypothetical protein [Acidimicrobiales bacterium]
MSPAEHLFDEYVMVDWSAATRPVTGANSIWVAHGRRRRGGLGVSTANPPTRDEACRHLVELLEGAIGRRATVLVGVDFSFGYPEGFSTYTEGLVRPADVPWRRAWRVLSERIEDGPDNTNNRFAVADGINGATRTALFWGRPMGPRFDGLAHLAPTSAVPAHLAARRCATLRVTERLAGPGIKSGWQLFGGITVGGQVLVGLPRLASLLGHFGEAAVVWPFETGLTADPRHRSDARSAASLVFAEIWPGAVALTTTASGVRDEAQVVSVVRACAGRDPAGLGAWFAPDAARSLSPGGRTAVEEEEGWILGVGA